MSMGILEWRAEPYPSRVAGTLNKEPRDTFRPGKPGQG